MDFAFCVLTCVSLEDQADEGKDSLPDQLRKAQAYGERWGGTFTREYRAEGFSRSGWYDLTKALQKNKSFYELAEDAKRHKFDVVVVDSYDRLGDLAIAFFNYFSDQGEPYIQLVSAQQRILIEEPRDYHPRRDDSIPNALAESLKVNKYRTNKTFRAFEIGNTRRAKDGNYANTYPAGYIKRPDGSLILDEPVAGLLKNFPKWFLSGATYTDIGRRADQTDVPPPETDYWDPRLVKYILRNPFYAGKVFYGRRERISKGHYRDREQYDLYDGNHPALWTLDTHLQILTEIKRRGRHKAKSSDYNFTKLLQCAECGDYLSIVYASVRPQNKYWRCLNCGKVNISTKRADEQVIAELNRLLKDMDYTPTPEMAVKDSTRKEIAKLETQLRRDMEAYDAGAYSATEYADLRRVKLARMDELRDEQLQMETAKRGAEERAELITTMRELLPTLPIWITKKPRSVNYYLSYLFTLTARPDKTITMEWRSES